MGIVKVVRWIGLEILIPNHMQKNQIQHEEQILAQNAMGHFLGHPVHSAEKLKQCSQYNFAFSQAGYLRRHLKTHSGEKSNATNATMSLHMQVIWRHI